MLVYGFIVTKMAFSFSLYSYHYKKKNCRIKDSKAGSLKIYLNTNEFVWFRASKTEANIVRIIADSPSKKKAELITKEALNLVKNK